MRRTRAAYFDEKVAARADEVIGQAVSAFVNGPPNLGGRRYAGIVRAPAGAGKSHLVATAAGTAVEATGGSGGTIVIAAPTNDQAYGLVASLSSRYPDVKVAFVPAAKRALPSSVARRANVSEVQAKEASTYPIVVGTLDKLGDAAARGDLPRFRYLCMDESFQADSAKYFKIGDVSDRHLLVGDPGQLDPFTTMADPDRWRGLSEDPTQTAVSVLQRNHRAAQFRMPITRRLPPSAIPLAEAFYPGHDFSPWTLPGARRAELTGAAGRREHRLLDATLERMITSGWAWARLPDTPVLTADPAMIETILGLVRRFLDRGPRVASELTDGKWSPVDANRIAVAVSHNDQKDYLRSAFDSAGMAFVRVDTANKLQGLEFDFVVAWHPLAGLPEADGFHLDPGRLCVMLTRHRHGCVVVGRAADPDLVSDVPPVSDTWLGDEADPVLDGWFAHSLVFERLGPFAVDL